MKQAFRQIVILIWKDLLIDLRRGENLLSMLLFALLILLVFHFSMGRQTAIFIGLLPGVVWVVFLLSGVLGLSKSFLQEMETGCIGAAHVAHRSKHPFSGQDVSNYAFLTDLPNSFYPSLSRFV